MKKEDKILKTLSPDFGQLRLTNTMLNKSIIDANTSIRRFAKLFEIDFETMVNGEKHSLSAKMELIVTYLFTKLLIEGIEDCLFQE